MTGRTAGVSGVVTIRIRRFHTHECDRGPCGDSVGECRGGDASFAVNEMEDSHSSWERRFEP